VVAPGIAEALLATAFGLGAAIPAVVIYNLFARSIAGHRALLGDAVSGVLRQASRDLDRPPSAHLSSAHQEMTPGGWMAAQAVLLQPRSWTAQAISSCFSSATGRVR
jgi:MotA/TolQ/ExbB proton channel family